MSITSTRLLAAWEQIEAGLEANQDALQLDGVDACRAQLAAELTHLRSCQARRSELHAESLEATRDFNVTLKRAHVQTLRLRTWLWLRYGPHSEKLKEFGFKPLSRGGTARPHKGPQDTPWKPVTTLK
jgi:hypothetical protein